MEINHVLIVEDDKEIREGVQIYLQSQGYKVFQAADGIEGLEVLEKEEIHLAIIDIMMPRMDGIRPAEKNSSVRCGRSAQSLRSRRAGQDQTDRR